MLSLLTTALLATVFLPPERAQPDARRDAPSGAPSSAEAPAPTLPTLPTLPSILVSTAWLAEHLDDSGLVVLHVAHRRSEYDAGHVPGARFLEYERIAPEVDGIPVELPSPELLRRAFEDVGVGDGARVVLYGDPMSAARAWATLDWMGLGDRAAVLDGGLAAWRAERRRVTRQAPPPPVRGTLTVHAQPERFVSASWVRERLDDARYALVDARPAREYTGADGGHDGMHAAGHIPGAHNLYWQELLVSRDDARLRPPAELRARFAQAGVAPGDTVVAYCFIGMRASVTYFVSRLLGFPTRLYDGSWVDWSARALPAVKGAAPGTLSDVR